MLRHQLLVGRDHRLAPREGRANHLGRHADTADCLDDHIHLGIGNHAFRVGVPQRLRHFERPGTGPIDIRHALEHHGGTHAPGNPGGVRQQYLDGARTHGAAANHANNNPVFRSRSQSNLAPKRFERREPQGRALIAWKSGIRWDPVTRLAGSILHPMRRHSRLAAARGTLSVKDKAAPTTRCLLLIRRLAVRSLQGGSSEKRLPPRASHPVRTTRVISSC